MAAPRLLLLLPLTAALIYLVAASSIARNPIQLLARVQNPIIDKPGHEIDPFSSFNLHFHLSESPTRLKLALEPNHNVIAANARVTYLNDNGLASHSEPLHRKDHHVYKGSAHARAHDGSWVYVGWARIVIHRHGPNPLFEGAFSINDDSHHIQLPSTYSRTKHINDPDLDDSRDEYMLVYRDSDVSEESQTSQNHIQNKRAESSLSCASDLLSFNNRPDHPIFQNNAHGSQSSWAAVPLWSIFGKRQIDQTPGTGNAGGVDLSQTIGDTAGCPGTKKVALVGIATDCGYAQNFPDTQAMRKYVISILNTASAVWEPTFNISLALQNLTISHRRCPASPQQSTLWNQDCSSSLTMQDRLNYFSKWRGDLGDSNSHWTLMTKCQQNGEVGLAWLGQACVQTASVSNVTGGGTETVSGANVVALTSNEWQVLAHETGHTFGAVHDCDSQTCQDLQYVDSQQCCPFRKSTCSANSKFIMNPYTLAGQNKFSQCTVGNVCTAIGRNSVSTSCLSDNNDVTTITGQQCGNGIVETGEDCDCGGEEGCAGDPCCNPQTCKYNDGAECDDVNEDCCKECKLAASGTVCRASTGPCDPEEKCSGKSASCPRDVLLPDGQSCVNKHAPESAGDLACASGQCTSRNLQCQTVLNSLTHKGNVNQTTACDDDTCILSCSNPASGANLCYRIQQNMLDGTPCGGGGNCRNGQCEDSDFGKEIVSWITDHKDIVIGVAVAVGVILLAVIGSCICGCIRRRKRQKQMPKMVPRQGPGPGWYGAPVSPAGQVPRQWPGAAGPPPETQPQSAVAGHNSYQGWRPQSPPRSGLYGAGIIGSRGAAPTQPPPYEPPPPFNQYTEFSRNIPRYA